MSAGPTMTRRERQQQTRKALLEAAGRLFCQRGLEGASVEDVAQAAGYTKGAFYANFKSKEELFLVMLDERFARELDRLDEALTGAQEPSEEARAAAADFIHFAGGEDWPSLYFQFVAHAARNEEFRQELATRHRAMRERVGEIFARWMEASGHEEVLPLDQLTAILCFMADGFLVDRIVDPELSEDLYPTMVGVFLRGLEAFGQDEVRDAR